MHSVWYSWLRGPAPVIASATVVAWIRDDVVVLINSLGRKVKLSTVRGALPQYVASAYPADLGVPAKH